ncbi:MAG TPA: hypothetical protein VF652_00155 [Allosphingosinicella sp.]
MILPARIAVLGAAIAAAQLAAQTRDARSPKPQAQPRTLYRCEHRIPNPGGHSGALTLSKTFWEDGSVQSFNVELEDWGGSFIRRSDGSANVTLRWPGDHLVRKGGPFSWAEGSIDVSFHGGSTSRYQVLPKERWRQVVVDRNRSVIVHERDGIRTLFLSGLDMRLVSELVPVSSPGRLWMSLDGLLAWGAGLETLTVYETLVSGRSRDPAAYPNSPMGRIRVVAEYEVDVPALNRKVEQVRSESRSWEAGLVNFRKACRRGIEETGEILVT